MHNIYSTILQILQEMEMWKTFQFQKFEHKFIIFDIF